MACIVVSPQAEAFIRNLPRDAALLKGIWDQLEEAANDPKHILPPALPYPWPMLNFPVHDSSNQVWAIVVLVKRERIGEPDETLSIILIQGGPIPAGLDPDDFFPT